MRDELAKQSIGILECDDTLFIEARFRVLELNVMLDEPLDPESN